ncbi:MAG: hypothetical protein R3C02_18875 [Planctomycetaceae bacterium]
MTRSRFHRWKWEIRVEFELEGELWTGQGITGLDEEYAGAIVHVDETAEEIDIPWTCSGDCLRTS